MFKTLISLGNWSIVHTTDYLTPEHNIYARHLSCNNKFDDDDVGWWIKGPPTCRYCLEVVPDEVQALLALRLNVLPGCETEEP